MTQKHDISHGDLVMVAGYIDRLFFVDGWQDVTYYEPDETYSETLYDLTCAHTGEIELAYAEDLAKVCSAEQADDYLMYHAPNPTLKYDIFSIGEALNFGLPKEGSKMRNKPGRQPTQRELSSMEAERRKQARKERKEKVDALLDEFNDYKALADEFGAEEYKARVEYISLKLAELAEEGRR